MNTDVRYPLNTGSFHTQSRSTQVVYDRGDAQPVAGGTVDDATFSYDATTGTYSLSRGSDIESFGLADFFTDSETWTLADHDEGDSEARLQIDDTEGYYLEPTTSYVRQVRIFTSSLNSIDDVRTYRVTDLVYGFPSDAASVPASGSASHRLELLGSRSDDAFDTLTLLHGGGLAMIDFDTGQMDFDGWFDAFNTRSQSFDMKLGVLTGSAQIASGTNSFQGSFEASEAAADTYTGELAGLFYGPHADEIGGTMYGMAGDKFMSLAFVGAAYPDMLPGDTLASLAGENRFWSVQSGFNSGSVTAYDPYSIWHQYSTYDAATQTYRVDTGLFYQSFSPSNRTPANDEGDLLSYRATQAVAGGGEAQYEIALFDGTTEGIALTYTSFVRVVGQWLDADDALVESIVSFTGFGLATPPHQIPQTGHASYSGRLFGYLHDGANLLTDLTGSSSLNVDFGTQLLSLALSPTGEDAVGNPLALGTYNFSGMIDARFSDTMTGSWDDGDGSMNGRFYGDSAQEYAAAFTLYDPAFGQVTGISVGAAD